MPVTGIESILCKDYHNFEPLLFSNSPVIIDASDFINYYNGKEIIHNLFGGEYLFLALEWHYILGHLKKCGIDPLFIFSVGVEKRGFELAYEINGMQKRLGMLKQLSKGYACESLLDVNPILSQTALVDLLDVVHVSHLCSPYNIQRSCSSLANLMCCPLLGTAPEYLLRCAKLPHVSYTGFSFIPLQCTTPRPVEIRPATVSDRSTEDFNSNPASQFALIAHRFIPEQTGIFQANLSVRPLLFLLLGTDSLPRIRLPKPLYSAMNTDDGSDYKTRRWNVLVKWLEQSTSSPMKIIEQICSCYEPSARDNVKRVLTDCLISYMPSASIGRKLSAILLDPLVDNYDNKLSEIPHDERNERVPTLPDINKVLNGDHSGADLDMLEFTKNWPPNMIHHFYKSSFARFVLASLYSAEGSVLPPAIEDAFAQASIWDASLPLRILHYAYLTGLECDDGKRLSVIEYVMVGDKPFRRCVYYKPVQVDKLPDSADRILESYLGFPLNDLSAPLASLVVAVVMWYKSTSALKPIPSSLDRSPSALSILLIAVATHFNFESLDISLLRFYEETTVFAERKVGTVIGSKAPNRTLHYGPFDVNIVQHFNCIQANFMFLRSAVFLLNQLLPNSKRSVIRNFSPVWKIFPSGRLMYAIAACLNKAEPSSRRHLCFNFWLPRLMRSRPGSSKTSELLLAASNMLDWAIDTATQLIAQSVSALEPVYVDHAAQDINFDLFEAPKPENSNRFKRSPFKKTTNNFKFHRQQELHRNHLSKHSCSNPMEVQKKVNKYKGTGTRTGYAERLKERLSLDGV